jgi:hypothetical protein
MAEEVFKNVQVLKGIPVDQFMATMGFFSASLGMSCEDCHSADDRNWEGFAVDNPKKRTARRMVTMMATINRDNFNGRQIVTCYSCHRGGDRPRITPDLDALYGPPPPADPNEIIQQAPGAPSADQILDKYLQAVGGPQRAASLTSFVATGTSAGWTGNRRSVLSRSLRRAPGQRTVIIHTSNGDSTRPTMDAPGGSRRRSGWIAVLALSGQELDGARLDAEMGFPARIKQLLGRWRVGFPATIDDREVDVVQGTSGGVTATLYFDKESGLLVRTRRYTDSPVGQFHRDHLADFREVSGVKMAYRWSTIWLDGRETLS